ncbi:MAG: hypothetical protein OXC41_03375 [Gammaproteobacteria bacterium]|nr:hypothetical protein [Gammaproteobacteria bacterium]
MSRFAILLSIVLTSQVAAHQPKGDPLKIAIELIGYGVSADCFDPRLLHGYPWKYGYPAINPGVLESKRILCMEQVMVATSTPNKPEFRRQALEILFGLPLSK